MAEKLFKNTKDQAKETLVLKYTVKRGDTLAKIARECGAEVETIVKANKLINVNQIREGQVLLIPGGKEKKSEKKGFTKAEK